ncbi:protein HUA2-LIKE 2 isoform X1 [Argentina anserina]|uniref:protein HUA2-LIKE 2 isoform X1 n=1 Tax=Argentina anserina TaxID=57926 RepID=UPI0021762136|nr:protein HUA2-LIKE 2 isoform X1 [Potentilla anserina]XP_050366915.1 protein HUA2-LIKE 2 isoform X1 [Potentilla anserina]
MAPSRRKGASKAAQAAAARRQWKVGDLVLAKVKGFPAWPATVSEPEKWGYSADWKKVLVFFFGTQQIAFCNPADVEAFTEEKKQSLLGKRHGADFVRAVQEIIDSFEKLKKDDQVAEVNSSAIDGNSVDSSCNFGSKDQKEAPEAILDLHPKSSSSTIDKNEPSNSVEDASATAQLDATLDKENLIGEPAATTMVSETPMPTTYSSRKRSGDLQLQNCASKREEAPARRSRSSLRTESRRLQNFVMPCDDDAKNSGDISANAVQDRSSRRIKRARKSPDASMCDEVELAVCVSNGCAEDDGSEVVPVDSGTFSLNDGSVIDSGCKGEHSEAAVECLEGDAELIKGLDLQIKAVSKKKRKPNRKRVTNDAAEPIAVLDKETVQEVCVQSSSQSIQTDCGNMSGSFSKEDGDEHLPLVKRARVRMNKPSSVEEVHITPHIQESLNEVMLNPSGMIKTSPICDDNCPAGRDSLVVNGALDNIAPPRVCTQSLENRPQLWNSKKDQSFGCSADGEAVLPPSKRLHRALEAMSANAAEDDRRCNDVSSVMMTSTIDCHNSSGNTCITINVESYSGNGLELNSDDSFGNNASGFSTTPNNVILEDNTKSSMEVDVCNQRRNSPDTQNNQCSIDGFPDSGHHNGGKVLSADCYAGTAVQTECPGKSPSMERREAGTGCNQGSVDELPRQDEGHAKFESSNKYAENLGSDDDKIESSHKDESPDADCDTSEHTLKSVVPEPGSSHGLVEVPGCIDFSQLHHVAGDSRENIKSLDPQLHENKDIQEMLDAVIEVKHNQIEKVPSSVSYPEEYLTGKHVAGVRSSPPLTDGGDFLAQTSPPSTSGCHISTSDSSNILQNNGSCSPDINLQHKRASTPVDEDEKSEAVVCQGPKSVSRYAEALAALSSFETILGTLTRTKDCIGRATRIAIDCGKIGVASKVLEILARHLENESSLHRRIDFFFLVDSIAQHSRGVKGDTGAMFSSAIQAVLPRLLSAAAPPGSSANENRRQCLKVLKLWLERRIVPESMIRHHMRELDTLGGSSAGAYCRRSSRTERSLDDPLREMEGMLVDEYGSNSSFQLPGFCMPRMLKDEDGGSDSDGESFEAVTPEHNPQTIEEHEAPATERHRHILEDVDGELEMEDVAPSCDVDISSSCGVAGVNVVQASHSQFEQHFPHPFPPPLPQDVPPSSPPLPSSPPPPPASAPLPPPHVIHPSCATSDLNPYTDTHNVHDCRVPPPCQQLNKPRINQAIPDAVHYHHTESRDLHGQMPDSTSCSYSSYPSNSGRNMPHTDGATFYNKGYPLWPPHAAPSNQFSYVKGDHHVKPRREVPPPYHNRFDYMQNGDREHYNNNHERTKPAPYEPHESWRFPPHSYSGPRYPEKGKASYGNAPFAGPPRGPSRYPGQGLRFPPRSTNHRHSFIPPYDGPIPVTNRGPGFWRPR